MTTPLLNRIITVLSDILDLDPATITADSYLIRDLNAESIDLLEIAVTLNSEFKTDIDDDAIFLKNLRIYLNEAGESQDDKRAYLAEKYPFLDQARIRDMVADLEAGPVLKVRDLASYIQARVADHE